jgi:ABC-type sugar transport system substrate-binding protein
MKKSVSAFWIRAWTIAAASAVLSGSVVATSLARDTNSGAQTRFIDTGPYNLGNPSRASSIEGAKLNSLGSLPKADGTKKVAVVLKALTNQYWQEVKRGIEDSSAKLGVKTSQITSATSENAPAEQLQICMTLAQQDYAAFIISPETDSNLNPCVAELRKKNIPVVNISAPANGSYATVYLGPDLQGQGTAAGQFLAKKLPPGSQVVSIDGLPASSAGRLRATGFKAAAEAGGLKAVGSQAADWDDGKAYAAARDFLTKYPNLRGIYAGNDTMGIAAAKAVEQAGKKQQVVVISTDGVPTAIQNVRDGGMAACGTPFPYYQGYWTIETALRLLGGQKVPEWIYTPDVVVTVNNVAHYFDDKGLAKPGLF